MQSQPPWREEFWTVGLILIVLMIGGRVTGTSIWPAVAGVAGYLGWNLYHLLSLFRYLDQPSLRMPDNIVGLWGYLFYRLQLKRRNEKGRKKQIKRLLKEFSSSAHALPDATIVLNDRFEIQWVNAPAAQLLNVSRNDTGQKIVDLIRHPAFQKYLRAENFKEPLTLIAPSNPDQSLLLRIVAYGQQQYLLLARDITERRHLEQMRRDFVSNASHELKTPLTVLQGSLDQLQSTGSNDPAIKKPIEWMHRQSKRMQRILDDLLTLARLEDPHLENEMAHNLVLADIVDTICQDARALSQQLGGHQFDIQVDSALTILGNERHIHTALSNLIMNAIQYTPPGGTITITWKHCANGARFSVQDTGPGIPTQHLARLTERFYRVDAGRSRETGGTGLGLAIVKHVLDPYHTSMEVQSTPGQGSCFSFTIPKEYIVQEVWAS